MAVRHGDERTIEPVVIRRAGHEKSHGIAVADDAKPPCIVGQVGMQRGIGLEPRVATALDGRRIRSHAGDLEDTVRIRLRQVVDLAFEPRAGSARALPEDVADVSAQQRIPRHVETATVDVEPSVRRLRRALDRH